MADRIIGATALTDMPGSIVSPATLTHVADRIVCTPALPHMAWRIIGAASLANMPRRIVGTPTLTHVAGRVISTAPAPGGAVAGRHAAHAATMARVGGTGAAARVAAAAVPA